MLATRFSVATLLISLVSTAGCGGSGNAPSNSPQHNEGSSARTKAPNSAAASQSAAPGKSSAKHVAARWLGSARGGSGEVACSLMTSGAMQRVMRLMLAAPRPSDSVVKKRGCPLYFQAFTAGYQGAPLKIAKLKVHASTATATLGCRPCRPRFVHGLRALHLIHRPGGWRVDFRPSTARVPGDAAVVERLPSPNCPQRALGALPLLGDSARHAKALVLSHEAPRLRPEAKVVPAPHAGVRGTEAIFACGKRIGDRTEVVFVHRRAFDHGRNRSASLGQGVFWVSRFEGGYRVWGSPHP